MSGYKTRQADKWAPVWPKTRIPVNISGTSLWVPEATEQIDILRMLNRLKGLARAEQIERAI